MPDLLDERPVPTLMYVVDGRPFATEMDALAWIERPPERRLVGLTFAHVVGALDLSDQKLGDAIEAVARKIRDARLAAGKSKRPKRTPERGAGAGAGGRVTVSQRLGRATVKILRARFPLAFPPKGAGEASA